MYEDCQLQHAVRGRETTNCTVVCVPTFMCSWRFSPGMPQSFKHWRDNPRAGDMANLVLQPWCKVFLSAGAGIESLSGLTFCMRLSQYMYGGTTALTARAALTPDGEAQSTQLGA